MYNFQYKPSSKSKPDNEYEYLKGICLGLIFCISLCISLVLLLVIIRNKIYQKDDYSMTINEIDTISNSGFYEYGYL